MCAAGKSHPIMCPCASISPDPHEFEGALPAFIFAGLVSRPRSWFCGRVGASGGRNCAIRFLANSAPIERLRNIVFDQYLRAAPRAWSPDLPVRIVDIDDASLSRLGQWPWPRRILADLTDKLAATGAAVIAFDVVFAEPDRYAPSAIIDELPAIPEREALRDALKAQGNDDPLARAFSRSPVVAATALVSRATDAFDPRSATKSSFVILGDDPRPMAPAFPAAVLPLPNCGRRRPGSARSIM